MASIRLSQSQMEMSKQLHLPFTGYFEPLAPQKSMKLAEADRSRTSAEIQMTIGARREHTDTDTGAQGTTAEMTTGATREHRVRRETRQRV